MMSNKRHYQERYMSKITIKALKDGPYVVSVDGKKVTALCRCGASNAKPNCDGSHTKIGFMAESVNI